MRFIFKKYTRYCVRARFSLINCVHVLHASRLHDDCENPFSQLLSQPLPSVTSTFQSYKPLGSRVALAHLL